MKQQKVLILDFGSQYSLLIARRVRECHVYCELHSWKISLEEILHFDPIGIIFSGGPGSVYDVNSPHPDPGIFHLGIPILGVCYGCQLLAQQFGGNVAPAQKSTSREYGKAQTFLDITSPLFQSLPPECITWMSHGDCITELPSGFSLTARSLSCSIAGIGDDTRKLYGVQFHIEVRHTEYGLEILRNFLYHICGANGDWDMNDFHRSAVASIRAKVGNDKVLLALSGGVDSSVAAALLSEAVGPALTCVFVDHGLMREKEGEMIEQFFSSKDMQYIHINAQDRFLRRLEDISDPEEKRKIIGEEFIRVFEEESAKLGKIKYLAQGTIYPDLVESGNGNSDVIKSHHNVGGLPANIDFQEILEPLRLLFKDEVRQLGRVIGLPENLVSRQPFPGPGLAIRIIGPITREKLKMLRKADAIFREEVEKAGLKDIASQYFAVLTNLHSVGVMGDGRTYDQAVALRCVTTDDFMTADWTRLPYEVLERTSVRIVNEVRGVNRVLYDITSKPPATVEWE